MVHPLYAKTRTTSNVSYPRSDMSGGGQRPTKIVVRQELGMHDVITSTHSGSFDYLYETLRSGSPIQVMAQSKESSVNWFGYVDSVQRESMTHDVVASTVTAVGATYPMKRTRDTVWSGTSVTDLISTMISDAGLSPLVSKVPAKQVVTQAGRSDFEVVRELCAAFGLHLFVTGTTVNVLTVSDILKFYDDTASTLVWSKDKNERALNPRMLNHFSESASDNNSGLDRWETEYRVAGVDPRTSDVYQRSEGSGMFTNFSGSTARSVMSVDWKSERALSVLGKEASARGLGSPSVVVGKPVYVSSPSGGAWWIVKKIEHVFTPSSGEYRMDALLGARGKMPSHLPSKQPTRNMVRNAVQCSCSENSPLLKGGSGSLVQGMGSWGQMDRWVARRCS